MQRFLMTTIAALVALLIAGEAQAQHRHRSSHGRSSGGKRTVHSRTSRAHSAHRAPRTTHRAYSSRRAAPRYKKASALSYRGYGKSTPRYGKSTARYGKSTSRYGKTTARYTRGGYKQKTVRDYHGPRRTTFKPRTVRTVRSTSPRRYRSFASSLVKKHHGQVRTFRGRVFDKRYLSRYGKRFSFRRSGALVNAWCYPGKSHRHWRFCTWNSYYRKWFFYDDCSRCFYYYCGNRGCYLPIAYQCEECCAQQDDPEVVPCDQQTQEDNTIDPNDVNDDIQDSDNGQNPQQQQDPNNAQDQENGDPNQ